MSKYIAQFTIPIRFDANGVPDLEVHNLVKVNYTTFSDGTDLEYLQAVSDIDSIILQRRENGANTFSGNT